eukprot:12200597-Heterocapsa_arctica.AAC.1
MTFKKAKGTEKRRGNTDGVQRATNMCGASAEMLPKPNMYTSSLLCGVNALAPRALIRNYSSNIRVIKAMSTQLMHA